MLYRLAAIKETLRFHLAGTTLPQTVPKGRMKLRSVQFPKGGSSFSLSEQIIR